MKITTSNKLAKKLAIQKAYGEHWEKVKDHVTEWGALSYQDCTDIFGEHKFYFGTKSISSIWKNDYSGYYHPPEIHNISYNKGWTRIEPNGSNLPTHQTTCHFLNVNDPNDNGEALWEYLDEDKQYHLDNHTHFRAPRDKFERPQY